MPVKAAFALVGLLLAGAPGKKKPTAQVLPERLEWPHEKVVAEVDVPGVLRVDGRPVLLHAILVEGALPNIANDYRRALREAGLYIPPRRNLTQYSNLQIGLVGLDTKTFHSVVVILQAYGPSRTGVIMGDIDMSVPAVTATVGQVPVLPDAAHLMHLDDEVGSSLTYETAQPADKIIAFYREAMPKAGFTEGAPGPQGTPRFVRGSEQLDVLVQGAEAGKTRVICIRHGSPETDNPLVPDGIKAAQAALDRVARDAGLPVVPATVPSGSSAP